MKTIDMRTLTDLDIVLRVGRDHLEKHGECRVVIKHIEETLTDAQRAYHWVLSGIIGADTGATKNDQHKYFKEHFLLNIYINDPENHPESIGVVDHMQVVKKNCPEQYQYVRGLVLKGVSLKDATKTNLMELLTEEINFANQHQVRIPLPPRSGLIPDSER
jgi:hypothetical protein